MKDPVVVAVSGGFDPMHIGHIEMLEQARSLGDELVVIVNNDHWLRKKKGYAFMPEQERVALLEKYPFVDRVVLTDHLPDDPDRSVSRTLEQIHPDIFANGGDRGATNTPEADVAERLGIRMAYGIGGEKVQSSSWMTAHANAAANTTRESWGSKRAHAHGNDWHLKTFHMDPGSELHIPEEASEEKIWVLLQGDAVLVSSVTPTAQALKRCVPIQATSRGAHILSSEGGCVIAECAVATSTSQA